MRCTTARNYFCRNRDGMLDESTRIDLQRHLAACPACAAWCGEMEECMKLLAGLPELETSENFEWNLRRRLAAERSRAMRGRVGMPFDDRAWGMRFVAGTAAALGVVFAATLLLGIRGPQRYADVARPAEDAAAVAVETGVPAGVRPAPVDFPVGIRYVSDQSLGAVQGAETARPLPFKIAEDPRIDRLTRENELLRRQVDELRRQNIIVRNLLLQCSQQREARR